MTSAHAMRQVAEVMAWALVLLLAPVLFIAWLIEDDSAKARRWRQQGMTQQGIANRLGISRYRVRKLLA